MSSYLTFHYFDLLQYKQPCQSDPREFDEVKLLRNKMQRCRFRIKFIRIVKIGSQMLSCNCFLVLV